MLQEVATSGYRPLPMNRSWSPGGSLNYSESCSTRPDPTTALARRLHWEVASPDPTHGGQAMTATVTETQTAAPTADRKAVEALLRDAAFVLRMTQRVKHDLYAEVPSVVRKTVRTVTR